MRGRLAVVSVVAVGALALVVPAGAFAQGHITGKVTAAVGGADVANYEVVAFPVGSNIELASACTQNDGTFDISVPGGAYEVLFRGHAGGGCTADSTYAPEWFEGSSIRANATELIVLDPGTRANVNASLELGATITGTVTNATGGGALHNVTVELLRVDGNPVQIACTGVNGTYALIRVPVDIYSVRFNAQGSCGNAGNFALQWWNNSPSQAGAAPVIPFAGGTESNINAALSPPASGGGGGGGGGGAGGGGGGAPNTKIDSSKITAKKGKASFSFSGSGGTGALSFECALTKGSTAPKFSGCTSPTSYKQLKKGKYTFHVRARDAAGALDGSPASQSFKSKKKKKKKR